MGQNYVRGSPALACLKPVTVKCHYVRYCLKLQTSEERRSTLQIHTKNHKVNHDKKKQNPYIIC